MIKSITFQGNRKFAANLYALEIKSRFIDQTHADGYYSGYGAELEAKVVGNQIQIGTGAFVVQGRISEVVSTEVVTPTIYGNCVGYVVARIETYHVSDDNNCTFKAYVNTALSEIPLRQDDVYATNADNENLVYELPIYSFEIKDRTIVNLQKLIKPIDDYARVQKEVDRIVKSTNEALALVQSATESSEQATMSADSAVRKVDSAVEVATEAKTTADGLADSIAQANTTADEARQIAVEAEQASSNAVATANEAKTTADGLADSIAQANTTAGEAKEMAEEALEQSKVTGTKVNVDGAFQSDLNFDSDPQEQLNDLKSADTALQNGKVNKSGDTMTGKLDMAGNAAIWNGNDSTFIEIGKVGRSGFEFHAQTNPNVYRDYDATIQATEANSTTADGSAKLNYIAREHNFQGGDCINFGQQLRGYKRVEINASLQGERSGFYSDAYEQYSKYIVAGDGGDKICIGWHYSDAAIHMKAYNSGNLQVDAIIPYIDPSKLEPTTANGWTVGGEDLAISDDGIYLVSVSTSSNGNYFGSPVIMTFQRMVLAPDLNPDVWILNSVSSCPQQKGILTSPMVLSYTGTGNYAKGTNTGSWTAIGLNYSSGLSKKTINHVAYKKIA